jgi:hypothetical protein
MHMISIVGLITMLLEAMHHMIEKWSFSCTYLSNHNQGTQKACRIIKNSNSQNSTIDYVILLYYDFLFGIIPLSFINQLINTRMVQFFNLVHISMS